MSEKVVGYLLVFSGVGIILFTLFNVYSVFTRKIDPVELFNFQGISLDLAQVAQVEVPQELEERGVTVNQKPAKPQEIIPAPLLNKTSNLIAHVILMGFMASGGFRIALLGAEIVRPVIVKVRPTEKSILLPQKKV